MRLFHCLCYIDAACLIARHDMPMLHAIHSAVATAAIDDAFVCCFEFALMRLRAMFARAARPLDALFDFSAALMRDFHAGARYDDIMPRC